MKQLIVETLPAPEHPAVVSGAAFHHLVRVRRTAAGQILRLSDGSGNVVEARVARIEGDRAILEYLRSVRFATESSRVVAIIAMLKGGRTDQVVRQLSELGTDAIHVVTTQHSVARLSPQAIPGRLRRWRAIAREASEQCGRPAVPEVDYLTSLDELGRPPGRAVIFHESAPGGIDLALAIDEDREPVAGQPLWFLIGPEGGLASEEVDRLAGEGWIPARLPFPILRAETAAVAAATLVQLVRSNYTPV